MGYKAFGKTHEYFPLISKKDYRKNQFGGFVKNYFEDSYQSLASFFTREENLSIEELEKIQKLIAEEINKKKDQS